jgi:DNA-binding SARP family transcriptional activator
MKPLRPTLSRLFALLGSLASAAVLVLLLQHRPALPKLPHSLVNPVTLGLVQGVLGLAAWGAGTLLAVLVFSDAVRRVLVRRASPDPLPLPRARFRSSAQARLAAARHAAFPPPFPLVLRPRAEHGTEGHALALALAPARDGVVAIAGHGVEVKRGAPPVQRIPKLPRPSIALLGPLAIMPSKPSRRGLRSQSQQLLAYLALRREGATTDELVGVFWPDLEDHKARKQLWRTVTDVRAKLGDAIARADARYQLDREAFAVDVDVFETLLAQADAADDTEREHLLEQALGLVRGQPLAGSDFPWAAGDTRRLRGTIVERLEQLGYLRLDGGNPAGALTAAEKALTMDPFHEGAHRLAMQAEAVLGLREAIAERFEQLSQELDSRFGLQPERETRVLYRQLLSQDVW